MLRAVGFAAACAVAAAQVQCDVDGSCSYNVAYKGTTLTFDFRRLCNANSDYILSDLYGHTYYAQICGYAAKPCLPATYETEYEYGRVVQAFGSPPSCAVPECFDERTRLPACCTEDCEVVGVRDPQFSLIDPSNVGAGVRITYLGASPTGSDQYVCPTDPTTSLPYPRMTHMEFTCDWNTDGFANFYGVQQNDTDKCDYTLQFKTSLVCVSTVAISGGWIFCIIVLAGFALYAVAGMIWVYRTEGIIAFPHRAFWAELHSLVFDGFMFIVRGFRKGGGHSKLSAAKEDPRPLFYNADASSATATDAPATSVVKNAYTEL